VEAEIEAAIEEPMVCAPSDDLGRARRINDAPGRYIEFCKSTFPHEQDLYGLKLVVDCAHGAAYHIAPHVFHELGADVVSIGNQPDGRNINDGYGATAPGKLIEAVKAHGADLGLAFDGDADRLQVVDADGRLYNGDELLYLIVRDRQAAGQAVPGAVGTLMTNMAVELALKRQGVEFVRAKVGDRYVLEELNKRSWTLGGEGSGHLLCLDRHSTGDGIVSALQVLSALKRSDKSLAECCAELTLYPQTLINKKVSPGFDWTSNSAVVAEKEAVERELGESGRVLIRASGTEPLIRVMVEAKEAEQAERMARRIADKLAA
ncbi:MAG: phosphoglucosamine mutase, partial [Sphingomonadaceae bacterium]